MDGDERSPGSEQRKLSKKKKTKKSTILIDRNHLCLKLSYMYSYTVARSMPPDL